MEKTIAAAGAAAADAVLPDDAIEEILQRVDDVTALFRCTLTCKPWRALVAKPSFLRRRWPEDSPESCSLFGFFAPQEEDDEEDEEHGGEQIFVPAPRSPLRRCLLGSFFPEAAGLLEDAELITSRRGLLLMLLNNDVSSGGIHLAVCNPLTGTCDVLPSLKRSDKDFDTSGCAILTGADLSSKVQQNPLPGYSTFFKVLICVHQDVWGYDSERISCGYDLHIFSSNEASWTEPKECFNQLHVKDLEMMGRAVVCQGTAHWLLQTKSDNYTLQVSADTGHVTFTKLPIELDTFEIGWLTVNTDGVLSFFGPIYEDGQIEFWTPRDGNNTAEWLCTRRIKLEIPKQEQDDEEESLIICGVGERSGRVLLLDSGVHVADLKTGATEDVSTQFSGLEAGLSVPFEVDWADFFSSRLM